MSEPTPDTQPVKAFDRQGNKIELPASDVPELVKLGGRVATPQELAEHKAEQDYAQKSTVEKVTGPLRYASPFTFAASLAATGQAPVLPPTLESHLQGVGEGLGAGLPQLAVKEATRLAGGDQAARAYADRAETASTAHPTAGTVGQVVGMGVGAMMGRAAPTGLLSEVGAGVEAGVGRAMAGVAAKGVLGRAATTGAELAARGFIEAAGYNAATELSKAAFLDQEINGEKLYSIAGHSALAGLFGAGGGAVLGGSGSLVASGGRAAYRGAVGGISKLAQVGELGLARGQAAIEQTIGKGRAVVDELGAKAETAAAEAKALGKDAADAAKGAAKGAAEDAATGARRMAGEAVDDGVKTGRTLAEITGTKIEQEQAAMRATVERLKTPEAQKAFAYDLAWKQVGGGQGLQSTRFAKQAEKYLPNGTQDVGEILMRKGILDVEQGAFAAAKSGTAAEMLPKIAAAVEENGARLGAITNASGATIGAKDINGLFANVLDRYGSIAGREGEVAAIKAYRENLLQKLNVGDTWAAHAGDFSALDGRAAEATIQDVLKQRKGLDEIIYAEQKTLDPKGRLAALRDVRSEMERMLMDKLDEASGKVPGELRKEYQALKRDHVALSIAKDAAEDSAARMAKARSVSLTDYLAGAGSLPLTLGHKVLRERGNAAAAVTLYRMAESGSLTRAIEAADQAVTKAAKGALQIASEAKATPGAQSPRTGFNFGERVAQASQRVAQAGKRQEPVQVQEIRRQAAAVIKWQGDVRANPQPSIQQIQEAAAQIGQQSGPKAAAAYSAAAFKALTFVASHIPAKERRDPLDPRSVPPLTTEEADRVVRAAKYAARPASVWEDFERGRVTPEGIAAAETFMPEQLASFRQQLLSDVTERMARDQRLTATQRLRIDKLLGGVPAGPDLRPENLAKLQSNFAPVPPEPAPTAPPAPTGGKKVDMQVQQTGFDAVEARKAG